MAIPTTDPKTLTADQVFDYARRSVSRGKDGTNRSIADQHACNLETAEFHGLPLTEDNLLTEDKNHGGNEWWARCPDIELDWGAATGQPSRPVLTKLIRGVVTGKIKAVLVWSTDRLLRDIGIANVLADLFAKHGCLLYDRNGLVPLDSPEARGNFFQTVLSSQQYREMCAVNSPRSVTKLLQRSRICVTGDVLGYRHVSKGKIRIEKNEIAIVNRIFAMYCGGMTKGAIARQLMTEGIVLTPDLYDKRSVKRCDDTYKLIYTKQINTVLRDVRYQGKQPYANPDGSGTKVWACPAFLIDNETAVPVALFEKAQELLRDPRTKSNNVSPDNYLAGLFKCGLCGQYLTVNPVTQRSDGTIKKYWISKKHDIQTWCTHSLPNITESAMRSYTEQVLLPLLMAELDTMRETLEGTDASAELAVLRNLIVEQKQSYKDSIKKQFKEGTLSGLTASILEEEHQEEIGGLETRIGELEQIIRDRAAIAANHQRTSSAIERWNTYTDAEKRLAIHNVLRWVVMLPSEDFAARPKRRGGARTIDRKKDGAPPAGRVLYLTAWNTFHTAVVKRVSNPESTTWHKQLGLVPAPLEECIGSCADLPDPSGLAAGLERSYKGRSFKFHPSEVMPGYLSPQKIAEFEVE